MNTQRNKLIIAISYEKQFALLKERGKTKYYLRKNGVSPSILAKIKKKTGGLVHRTINKICELLDCQLGDIMEYIKDE